MNRRDLALLVRRVNAAPPGDPYRVMGVPPGVKAAELRPAWLALMRALHPDRNPGDAAAAQAAARVNVAYDTLRDPDRRRATDRLLHTAAGTCLRCAGVGGVLKQKGWGAKVPVKCPACGGSGRAGSEAK